MPVNSERRWRIIALLSTMNDGLPATPTRREHSTPGFVNEPRARSCHDCLANGRIMHGCETCGGQGQLSPARVDQVALPDTLPDDGSSRDPYAVSSKVQAYGVRDTAKLGHVPERDTAIDRARQQAQDRPASEQDAAAETGPYLWERERAAMFRRYDYGALQHALELLRDHDDRLSAAVVSVYTHRVVEPSTTLEAAVEQGLRFIDRLMPDPIRAPGSEHKHPALVRRDRRRQEEAA